MITIFFVLLQLLLALFFFFLCLAFVIGGPFVPSKRMSTKAMIKLARLSPGMNVCDLGSGDGRLLFLAAREGTHAVGYEINPILVVYTLFRSFFSPYRQFVRVYWKNLWHADVSGADVVFIYLLPWHMDRLKSILIRQLAPGALIVSNSFIFSEWKPIRSDRINHVYVFRIQTAHNEHLNY